jgi:hypothetical protein
MDEWRFGCPPFGCIARHMHLLRDAIEETEIVKLHLFFYPVSKEMVPMFFGILCIQAAPKVSNRNWPT